MRRYTLDRDIVGSRADAVSPSLVATIREKSIVLEGGCGSASAARAIRGPRRPRARRRRPTNAVVRYPLLA